MDEEKKRKTSKQILIPISVNRRTLKNTNITLKKATIQNREQRVEIRDLKLVKLDYHLQKALVFSANSLFSHNETCFPTALSVLNRYKKIKL